MWERHTQQSKVTKQTTLGFKSVYLMQLIHGKEIYFHQVISINNIYLSHITTTQEPAARNILLGYI
jgi:hypothetical protein